tara:strand:+ start:383 stop:568 length:186 start_codon:yes stop_codon:yes gene_type:complete
MNFDIDQLQSALDDAERVVYALQAARDKVNDEDWEALPEAIMNVLDYACDLECSMGMESAD